MSDPKKISDSNPKSNKCFGDLNKKIQVEIVLKKINLEPLDISDALLYYDENILSKDICELLLSILPNESENINMNKPIEKLNPKDLSLYESFVILIWGIPYYKERLESIIFKLIYTDKFRKILTSINNIYEQFNFVKTDLKFHKYLDILLEQSDLIKDKTLQKNWKYGVLISSLPKIYDMKAKDNKMNILDYAKGTLIKNDPKFFDHIMENFEIFETFDSKMNLINDSFIALDEKFKSVEILKKMTIKEKELMEDEDNTENFLVSFYDHAKKCLDEIRKRIGTTAMNKEFNELSEYLGLKYVFNDGNFISFKDFILIMKEFYIRTKKIILAEPYEKFPEKPLPKNESKLNDNKGSIINIIFSSSDQKFKIPLSFDSNTKFYVVEDFIYGKFPDYKEDENYFLVNGTKINRFKTLKENNIKDGNNIILYAIE